MGFGQERTRATAELKRLLHITFLSSPRKQCEFAGCDVLWHLEGPVEQRLRSQQPGAALTSAHAHRRIRPLVRDILHQHCYVALDYQRELRRLSEGLGHAEHPLPDGTTLKLSTELVECTELLFDNSIRSKARQHSVQCKTGELGLEHVVTSPFKLISLVLT